MIIKIQKLECLRCSHKWTPRKNDIRLCPKCKSAYWDKMKQNKND